jgi:hypothetical protein
MFFSKKHPSKGFVYAITTGIYAGQLFVFMEKTKQNEYKFLSLPEMVAKAVPTDKFDFGLKTKIVDIVERLPKDIYATCIKQYRKNSTLDK